MQIRWAANINNNYLTGYSCCHLQQKIWHRMKQGNRISHGNHAANFNNDHYSNINGLCNGKMTVAMTAHTKEIKLIPRYLFFNWMEDNFEPWKVVGSCIYHRSS